MKQNCYSKKQAGCPQWILDGVRRVREQATQKRISTAGAQTENVLDQTTESEVDIYDKADRRGESMDASFDNNQAGYPYAVEPETDVV